MIAPNGCQIRTGREGGRSVGALRHLANHGRHALRRRPVRRVTLGAGLALAAAASGVWLSVTVSAASPVDIRGDWAEVTFALGTQFPQVLHITSEDLNTGAFSGTDGGGATGNGQQFSLAGVV